LTQLQLINGWTGTRKCSTLLQQLTRAKHDSLINSPCCRVLADMLMMMVTALINILTITGHRSLEWGGNNNFILLFSDSCVTFIFACQTKIKYFLSTRLATTDNVNTITVSYVNEFSFKLKMRVF